jgi:hypothetical protein
MSFKSALFINHSRISVCPDLFRTIYIIANCKQSLLSLSGSLFLHKCIRTLYVGLSTTSPHIFSRSCYPACPRQIRKRLCIEGLLITLISYVNVQMSQRVMQNIFYRSSKKLVWIFTGLTNISRNHLFSTI